MYAVIYDNPYDGYRATRYALFGKEQDAETFESQLRASCLFVWSAGWVNDFEAKRLEESEHYKLDESNSKK